MWQSNSPCRPPPEGPVNRVPSLPQQVVDGRDEEQLSEAPGGGDQRPAGRPPEEELLGLPRRTGHAFSFPQSQGSAGLDLLTWPQR